MPYDVRDGMRIVRDAPVAASDGLVLRADVFRPIGEGPFPAILSYGPYAKGMSFAESRPFAWQRLVASHPAAMAATSNKHQAWELPDPERWVRDGYAIVRVDARGTGRSPGYMDPWSPRETQDIYECIAWAAAQPWCNGRIGMSGISYYAMNQYQVAALQPPQLAAICAWEGAGDHYREVAYHGGIFSQFIANWYPRAAMTMQHGVGERGMRSAITGELVAGPQTLSEEELSRNRSDIVAAALAHPLDDAYHRARSPDWGKVRVPMLSAANWGGQGLHTRGNFAAFQHAASRHKWLEAHGDTHWTEYYSDYGIDLQRRFLGHFLKGEDNGWDRQPRVLLNIRHPGGRMVRRTENEWPLARTCWSRFYLDAATGALRDTPADAECKASFDAMGPGLTFRTPALAQPLEITGPSAARLFVSSSTEDADLFLMLRVLAPDDSEVVFQGAQDPRTPVGQGWLRASHRKLDPARSLPWQPWHAHDELWPLIPGEPVELDVEIWPTSIVVPAGYRIALTVRGCDYRFDGPAIEASGVPYPQTGVGPFLHEEPADRPPAVFHGVTTLHFGARRQSYVLLPVIPEP
jgi:predicted acyl esterase